MAARSTGEYRPRSPVSSRYIGQREEKVGVARRGLNEGSGRETRVPRRDTVDAFSRAPTIAYARCRLRFFIDEFDSMQLHLVLALFFVLFFLSFFLTRFSTLRDSILFFFFYFIFFSFFFLLLSFIYTFDFLIRRVKFPTLK